MACSSSKFLSNRGGSRRLTILLLLLPVATLFALASVALPRPVRAADCGAPVLGPLGERLRTLEAAPPATRDDALRRSALLAQLLSEPPGPCASQAPDDQLRDLARARVLALWGKMLALQAIDAAVFPAPYRRQCAAYDGASLQTSFIQAWVARLDPAGADAQPGALRDALDADPLFPHVSDLALERARRLRVTQLPPAGADEAAWLQASEALRARAAAQLPVGLHCGPIAGLWGI